MIAKKKEVETLSVRVWPKQLEIVDLGARALGMDRADYVRFRFIPLAAEDAGVDLPVFPPFGQPGRPGKVAPEVAHAARLAGLPAQEFINRSIAAGVEAVMRISSSPPPTESGIPPVAESEPAPRAVRRRR